MKKIAVTVGTRPEVVKMAPLVHELRKRKDTFQTILISTAQHREMLDQALNVFGLEPDFDLDIMEPGQSLSSSTARALEGMGGLLAELHPDLLLVQGDTSTVLAGALAAHYLKIPVGHVEAGLRTDDPYLPFPEEMNRRLTTRLCKLHFAPTELASRNLKEEGVAPEYIFQTGITVIDALLWIKKRYARSLPRRALEVIENGHKLVLVTVHRRESLDLHIHGIMKALKRIVDAHPEIEIVYPVHLNPRVQEAATSVLDQVERIHLIPPVSYPEMVNMMEACYLVLTDSGGIQEEAPTFGKPVLVLRKITERPEAVEAGVSRLVGVAPERIFTEASRLINSTVAYQEMSKKVSPFGDGLACRRIARYVEQFLSS